MFDDYSATLPLIIVVIFQTISVAWVYGADRYHKPSELKRKCLYLWFNVHKHDVYSMQVFGGPEADVGSAGSCGVQVHVEVRVSGCYAGALGCQSAKDVLGASHIHRLEQRKGKIMCALINKPLL